MIKYSCNVSSSLNSCATKGGPSDSAAAALAAALSYGLNELYKDTAARKGHKTLMDALIPFVETFAVSLDFTIAVAEADEGAEGTRRLDAVLGRASYVGKEAFERYGGVPDPGALAVVSVLRGIEAGLKH
jgi:triose/dihydroxyacetone kinase / FAD-AMP lyase (cyclizing)